MRIIDQKNNRDYYDVIQRYDEDRELIYLRKQENVVIEKPKGFLSFLPYLASDYNYVVMIIGFCGQIYPLIKIKKATYMDKELYHICYSIEDLDKFVKNNFSSSVALDYLAEKNKWWGWGKTDIGTCREQFVKFFEEAKIVPFVTKSDVPIWIYKNPSYDEQYKLNIKLKCNERLISYNCHLKELEFFRIKPTSTAYQEIRMFLGNLTASNKEIPKMSDEILINSHGFNRYSFRKDKSN